MSICDDCIHDDVCGLEDNHEEGIVSCADRIPKNVFDKIRAEIEQLSTFKCTETCRVYIDADDFKKNVLEIIDKYTNK